MRDVAVTQEPYPACCGADVLCEFPLMFDYKDGVNTLSKKPLTKKEWMTLIYTAHLDVAGVEEKLVPLYTFIHSREANKGPCTPAKFAAWLRRQGEKVTMTPPVQNHNSGHTIIGYFWAPSSKFQKAFSKFYEKQEKEDNADRRSSYDSW